MPTRVELAPGWHPPDARSFCDALPALAAAPADVDVVHRARNVLFRARVGGREVLVKHFRNRSLLRRLIYRFRSGKAERSFRHALRLRAMGFDTPEPLAWTELRQRGLPRESFYVSAWIDGCVQARACRDPAREDRLDRAREIGSLAARLHTAGIRHRDFTAGNILMRQDGDGGWRYELVDLNRMRFGAVPGRAWSLRSLASLEFDPPLRDALLEGYCAGRGWDSAACVPAYDRFLRHHRRWFAWKRKTRRWRRLLAGQRT